MDQQRSEIDALSAPIDATGGYLAFADALKTSAGRDPFFRELKDRLTLPKGGARFRRTHAAIACLSVDGIVTTNFDMCLSEQSLDALECYDPAMVDQIAAIAAPVPPHRPAVIPLLGQDTGFGPAPASEDSTQEWSKLPQVNPGQYIERRDGAGWNRIAAMRAQCTIEEPRPGSATAIRYFMR